MPANTTDKAMQLRSICFGDCLEHLKRWIRWNKSLTDLLPSKADLIYLDPPWNSGRNYNILFGKAEANDDDSQTAQETAFTDIWEWDDASADRVQELIQAQFLPSGHPKYPLKKVAKVMESLENILPGTARWRTALTWRNDSPSAANCSKTPALSISIAIQPPAII